LIPLRWEGLPEASGLNPLPLEASSDIFAFGLCILELLTLKQLDPQHCSQWPDLAASLADEEARVFVSKCLSSESRPNATELLEDPFLSIKKEPASGTASLNESMQRSMMQQTLQEAIAAATQADKRAGPDDSASVPAGDEIGSGPIAVGKLRGEDYIFEFHGKVTDPYVVSCLS
jgi:WNK lysine deficient protein kinase